MSSFVEYHLISFWNNVNKLDWVVPEILIVHSEKWSFSSILEWNEEKHFTFFFIMTRKCTNKCDLITTFTIQLSVSEFFREPKKNHQQRKNDMASFVFLLAQFLSNEMMWADIYLECSLRNDISRMKYRITPKTWLKMKVFFSLSPNNFFLYLDIHNHCQAMHTKYRIETM